MSRGCKGLSLLSLMLVAACQTDTGAPSANLSINSSQQPAKAVATIAIVAQKCWFKSGDEVFKPYRMSNEVNSFSGRPRFLLVKRSDPRGLPTLVVQAEQKGDTASGKFTNIQAFGPLLQTQSGKRITDDVARWSKGDTQCA